MPNNMHLSQCPLCHDPPVMGYCLQCKEPLRHDYEYYIDNDDNSFCSQECAIKYYGIKEMEWDND